MPHKKSIITLRLDGGILCLDFVNTISNRKKSKAHDYLSCYKDLLLWYEHTGALPPKMMRTIERLAKSYPAKATVVFEKSIVLRELLHRLYMAVIAQKPPTAADLALFNGYIADAYVNIEMNWLKNNKVGNLQFSTPALEQVYWWVVNSAVMLYTSKNLDQIKACPSCGWLFLDKSRNGSRKWCSMNTCGDINKVQQSYQRSKQKQP